MIDIENRCKINFDLGLLERVAEYLTPKDVELLLVNKDDIRDINAKFRSKDSVTDVLSFPIEQEIDHLPLGAIVICVDVAKEVALEHGHSLDEEIALLFLHGMLHLLGFDHELDSGEHREKEIEVIERFLLPTSLIVRSEIE